MMRKERKTVKREQVHGSMRGRTGVDGRSDLYNQANGTDRTDKADGTD